MIDLPDEDSPPFAALLPLAAESGVYSLPAPNLAPLVDAAEALDFAVHRVRLDHCRDKAAVLERFAHALSFPDWTGRNWDALADALADLSWLDDAPGRVLVLEGSQDFRAAAQADYDTLVVLLDDAAASWREIDLPFWSFLCEHPAGDDATEAAESPR
jgi:RNAse (barnase) inhibitor barstar